MCYPYLLSVPPSSSHFISTRPNLAENIETKAENDPLSTYLTGGRLPIEDRSAFQRVDPEIIENEINKLKCSKAAGNDKILVKLVKDSAGTLSKPLATIFNSSLENGVYLNL